MKTIRQHALDVATLCEGKQQAYGDSFGRTAELMQMLYPRGVRPEQYLNFTASARILDKLFRLAQDNDPHGENPLLDIAGNALVALRHSPERKGSKGPCFASGAVEGSREGGSNNAAGTARTVARRLRTTPKSVKSGRRLPKLSVSRSASSSARAAVPARTVTVIAFASAVARAKGQFRSGRRGAW